MSNKKKPSLQYYMNELKTSKDSIISYLFSAILFFLLSLILFYNLYNPPFSNDSWSYYEISKTIFSDIGRINNLRNYQINLDSGYTSSFPLFWPFLIACFNKLFIDVGIYAGLFLNFIIVSISFFLNFIISRNLTKTIIPGILISYCMILDQYYIDEVISGRSIPLALLMFQAIFMTFFCFDRVNTKSAIFLALIAGFYANTRFDFLLAGFVISLSIMVKNKNISLKENMLFILTYLFLISPWVIYSLYHFNVIWVSDNSRTVLLAFQSHVINFLQQDVWYPTIFNSPLTWFKNYFLNRLIPITKIFLYLLFSGSFLILLIIFNIKFRKGLLRKDFLNSIYAILPIIIILFFSISLAGYLEKRYFSIILWVAISAIIYLYSDSSKVKIKYLTLLFSIVAFDNIYSGHIKPHDHKITLNKDLINNKNYNDLSLVIKNDKILFLDKMNSYKFSALTGVKVATMPEILENYNKKSAIYEFLQYYKPKYIYFNKDDVSAKDSFNILKREYLITRTNIDNLYKITIHGNKN